MTQYIIPAISLVLAVLTFWRLTRKDKQELLNGLSEKIDQNYRELGEKIDKINETTNKHSERIALLEYRVEQIEKK